MSQAAFSPPDLPKGLESLAELALDLRWTWSHEADHLWRALDRDTWEATANPWLLLPWPPQNLRISPERRRVL
jgi:glycogen phosphorylase